MINTEYDDFVPWEGTPRTPKSDRVHNPGTWTIENGGVRKQNRLRKENRVNGVRTRPAKPGELAYGSIRESRLTMFRNKPGFANYRRFGTMDGYSREEALKIRIWAKEQAKKDLEVIMEKHPEIKENEVIQEALMATLEVMRTPVNQELKLKAARQLLDFLKAKPVSVQNITVNATEQWLDSLHNKENDK